MKFEKSENWVPNGTYWRVTSDYFHWGPWSRTKTRAAIQWLLNLKLWYELRRPILRLYRYGQAKCLVCGKSCYHPVMRARYCSFDCAAYDGALKDPKKSWVMFGTIKLPKQHHESRR